MGFVDVIRPVGTVFVPSFNASVSHSPDEPTTTADLAADTPSATPA
jgi:hypothetical protein